MQFEVPDNLDNYRRVQGWMLDGMPEENHVPWVLATAETFNRLYNEDERFRNLVKSVTGVEDRDHLNKIKDWLENSVSETKKAA